MSTVYRVKYTVRGSGHDGYCSGAENTDGDRVGRVTVHINYPDSVPEKSDLNMTYPSCHGSGWCKGYSDWTFTPVSVEPVDTSYLDDTVLVWGLIDGDDLLRMVQWYDEDDD